MDRFEFYDFALVGGDQFKLHVYDNLAGIDYSVSGFYQLGVDAEWEWDRFTGTDKEVEIIVFDFFCISYVYGFDETGKLISSNFVDLPKPLVEQIELSIQDLIYENVNDANTEVL